MRGFIRKIVSVLLCVASVIVFVQIIGCGEKHETAKDSKDSKVETKVAELSSDSDWPMFGRTPEGNRIATNGCGPKTDKLELKWEFEAPNQGKYSPIYVAFGESVYVGTDTNEIRCLNASDLSVKWVFKSNTWFDPYFDSYGNRLFLATGHASSLENDSDDKVFYCIDAKDGNVLWKIEESHKLYRDDSDSILSILFEEERLYLQTHGGNIVCIDKNNGAILWYYYTFNRFYTNLKIIDNKLYFWDMDFVCLNAKNGKIIWKFEDEKNKEKDDVNLDCLRGDGRPRMEHIPAMFEKKVYLTRYYTVFCLDWDTGRMLWKYETNYLPQVTLVDNRIVVVSRYCENANFLATELECLDGDSGASFWNCIIHGYNILSMILPIIDYQDNKYNTLKVLNKKIIASFHLEKENIYSLICLDVDSGNLVWNKYLPNDEPNQILVVDKTIYMGGEKLGCIDIETGKTLWEKSYTNSKNVKSVKMSTPIPIQADKLLILLEEHLDASETIQKTICTDLDGKKIWEFHVMLYHQSLNHDILKIHNSNIMFENDGTFYYMNIDTGKVVWIKKPYGYNKTFPATANGNAYIALNTIYCLDIEKGSIVWEYSENNEYFLHSPAISDGKLYCAADNERMYCIDSDIGKMIWTYYTKGKIVTSPIVSDGKLYIMASKNTKDKTNNRIICLDSITGAKVWEKQLEKEIPFPPVISNGKTLVINDSNLECFDNTSGNTIWSYDASDAITVNPTICDGKIFVGTENFIYCINIENGNTIFEHKTGAKLNSTILQYDNRIFYNTADKFVHCLDLGTKKVAWEKEIVWMNPNIEKVSNTINNGKYYVVDNYNIYSLDTQKGDITLDHYKGYLRWDFDSEKGYPFEEIKFVPYVALSYGKMILVSPEGKIMCYGDKQTPKKEE